MPKTKAASARALSLHLGLNAVDPTHYEGWGGELDACEFDAKDMAALAKSRKMKPTVLLTKKATREGVLAALRAAAKTLKSGDLFFLTYSGHGGQVPDVTGEEDDKLDETWCLYDGELIDDELYLELGRFAKGVRVLVLSDSCHSGTVTRASRPRGRATIEDDAADGREADVRRAQGLLRQAPAATSPRPPEDGAALDPDAALANVHADASHAADAHREEVQGGGHPHLRMSGQPDLDGRRPERRVHRAAPEGVEPGRLSRHVQDVSRGDQGGDAEESAAQSVRVRPHDGVREAAAVHRLTLRRPAPRASRGGADANPRSFARTASDARCSAAVARARYLASTKAAMSGD